tara:strand:+ start:472 stop:591 length:120 start_codon:yes stop_codon:yes gene_type:complete
MIIIFLALILIFGGGKISDLARSVGQGLKEFKKAINNSD